MCAGPVHPPPTWAGIRVVPEQRERCEQKRVYIVPGQVVPTNENNAVQCWLCACAKGMHVGVRVMSTHDRRELRLELLSPWKKDHERSWPNDGGDQ